MEIQRLCKKLHFDAQDVSITDLFLQVQQEIGQLQNWRQAMSQIGYKIQVDPQRSGMPSPAYWRPMVKFSLAMKIPLRPSQTIGNPLGMQQDTEHNSHCLNNSPWWPWCRISFSHFTVTMQASAQLWLIWRRLSNTFMALLDQLRTSSFTPVITERWETYGQTPEGIQDSKQINLRKANKVSEDNLLDPRNTRPINS